MGRASKLESEIRSQNLEFNSTSAIDSNLMNDVDNHRPPTTFVDFFYEMCEGGFPTDSNAYASPPTQSDFALAFFFKHKSENASKFTDEYMDAWERRAQVAYPSLVRDMHFFFLVSEYNQNHNVFDRVDYDPQMDIEDGVDTIVEVDDKTYYINLYVDTQKSRDFIEKKKTSRHPANNAVEIHLTVSRNDSRNKSVGDFWLYSEQHIEDMLAEMDIGA